MSFNLLSQCGKIHVKLKQGKFIFIYVFHDGKIITLCKICKIDMGKLYMIFNLLSQRGKILTCKIEIRKIYFHLCIS